MMIMKLRIKLLLNFVGPQVHVLHQWYGNPVMEIMLLDNGEPSDYEEAMTGPDSNKSLEAMKSEI